MVGARSNRGLKIRLKSGRKVAIPKNSLSVEELGEWLRCIYPGEEPADEPYRSLFVLSNTMIKVDESIKGDELESYR